MYILRPSAEKGRENRAYFLAKRRHSWQQQIHEYRDRNGFADSAAYRTKRD